MTENVYILLGSNLGDRENNLKIAVDKMRNIPGFTLVEKSSIYESDAVEMDDTSPKFLNQAVQAEYKKSPEQLLIELENIELSMGRSDKGLKKPRIIDLDILLFGSHTIRSKGLIIPHKELLNRPFALVPIVEISQELEHPVTKQVFKSYITVKDKALLSLYKGHVTGKI